MSVLKEVYIKEEVCVKEEQIEFDYQDVETEIEMKKYDECSIEFSNNTEQLKQFVVSKKRSPSQCIHCRKIFSDNHNLKKHIGTHTGEKPYKCSQCNQVFAQNRLLKRHMTKHTGEKPYMCSYCGKVFPDMMDLKRHVRIHTGEKPHQCSHCDIGFVDIRSLKNHLRKHSLDNLHNTIEAAFSDEGTLKSHIKTDTKKNPYLYQCSHCDMIFSTRRLLESHIRLQHKEKIPTISKQYKCSTCDETFAIINCINDKETITKQDSYKYKCNRCVDLFVREKFLVNHHQDVKYLPSVTKTEDNNPHYSEVTAADCNGLKRSSRKRKVVKYIDDFAKATKTQCISCKKEFTNIYIHVFKSSLCQNSYDMDLFKRQANEAKREKRLRKMYLYRQRQMAKDSEGFKAKQCVYRNASRKRQRDKKCSELAVETEMTENMTEVEVT